MLEGIREIDWATLGNPSIPDWIEGIGSKDETVRKQSYDAIYEANLDELHDASPSIVPYLIELLENDIEEKYSILLLLTQISGSTIGVLKRKYITYDLATETMNAIEKGTDVFLSLLSSDGLLPWDLQLLSNLKSQAAYLISHLEALCEKPEAYDGLRISIDRTIASLSGE